MTCRRMDSVGRILRRRVGDVIGPLGPRRAHLQTVLHEPTVLDATAFLQASGNAPEVDDDPIFLLSAGWRSGSTLLQRLVLSSEDALVWGEPWNRCDLISRMAESLRPISQSWPTAEMRIDRRDEHADLSNEWVANLFPPAGDLVEAHRALLRRLYADPAKSRGYERWGIKEVRFGVEEARYLRFLFPRSAIVLLVRDPVAAWASYRAKGLRSYVRWPGDPMLTARAFGRMWRDRACGFRDAADELGALFLRYEDLIAEPSVVDRIGAHVGCHLDRGVLEERIGGVGQPSVSMIERTVLRRTTGDVAEKLGY